jgi:hypothetical protein
MVFFFLATLTPTAPFSRILFQIRRKHKKKKKKSTKVQSSNPGTDKELVVVQLVAHTRISLSAKKKTKETKKKKKGKTREDKRRQDKSGDRSGRRKRS